LATPIAGFGVVEPVLGGGSATLESKKKKKSSVFKVLAKPPAKATRVVQPFLDRPYGVTETPPLGQMGVALNWSYGVVESTLGPNKGASATPKAHGKSFWGWLNYLQVP
jgi:hypothetical protein